MMVRSGKGVRHLLMAPLMTFMGMIIMTMSPVYAATEVRVLVLAPAVFEAEEILKGLSEELPESFDLIQKTVDAATTIDDLMVFFEESKPTAVVALNNTSVRLVRDFKTAQPDFSFPPVVVAMTSFVELEIEGMENVAGIHYEVPMVTGLREFRGLVNPKLKRVGILYRAGFGKMVQEQKAFLTPEGFEVVAVEIEESGRKLKREVNRALRSLLRHDPVDAIWVLNDNILLGHEILRDCWLPALREDRIPLLVGVRALVGRDLDFGTFAVLPENINLGAQVAELLFEIEENQWSAVGVGVQYPISVTKILNLSQLKSMGDVTGVRTEEIDEVID